MEEWLDIVDQDDRVVGRDTRRNIHERNEIHRASHILLLNSAGEVFVQQRSLTKDSGAGLWDTSVAGHVDSGESYLQCAVRECEEELGLYIEPDELRWVDKLAPQERNGFEFTAIYTIRTDQTPVPNADEIDDGRWLSPAELDLWIHKEPTVFTDVFRIIWALVKSHNFA